MPKKYKTAIVWIRREFRITDHTALCRAAAAAEAVVPVYIISDWTAEHAWTGPNRQDFLCGCLSSMAANLETIGGELIFRTGNAVEALRKLIKETKADALYYHHDPDPFGIETEKKVEVLCKKEFGIVVLGFHDSVLHARDEIVKGDGSPYRVYTPYSKRWLAAAKALPQKKPATLNTPSRIRSLKPPTLSTWRLEREINPAVEAGESAARIRMNKALVGPLLTYGQSRNTPFGVTTSRLSQDLRHGLISIRELYSKTMAMAESVGTASQRDSLHIFLKELAWREFYMQLLWHFPAVLDTEFSEKWRGMPWEDPEGQSEPFQAWAEGRTGFPLVDAGMRELNATGFMHNRVRMVVSMFLTKDLHIHWRAGERYFMQKLIDGEIASNNGGWQWSAGTGADAAPYFRIQNPWTQTKSHDSKAEYIKFWIPELEDVDPKRMYTQPKPDAPLADGYPSAIVDHQTERVRTLDIYKKHAG